MSQKSSQRFRLAASAKTILEFPLGCWLYIWICLLTASVSESISLMLTSSYNEQGEEVQSAIKETPYYESRTASAIQIEEETNSSEENSKLYALTSTFDGLLDSIELSFSSDLSEVTYTPLPHEIATDFIRVTEIPTQVLFTDLYSTIEPSNISPYTKMSSTPFLPLNLNSLITSSETVNTTKPSIRIPTTNPITYHINSAFNISLPSTSMNIVNNEPSLSISLSDYPEPSFNSKKSSKSFTPTLNHELERTITNISEPLTTPFVAGKDNFRDEHARYFLVLKSNNCPPLGDGSVNAEILKALSSLGILNVTTNVTKTECQTRLNANITATVSGSAILKLKDISDLNLTIFNQSFQIIDLHQLEFNFNKTDAKLTSNVISLVTQNIFKAYVAVGSCSGLVLLVCFMVYCFKCWTHKSRKRLGLRSNHSPLSPEDYTLTPIPRPTSLYVDYYRNSITADLYSTTSAGSAGSVSPTGETGVVQPFDTSIVPLADSETHFQESNLRKDSAGPSKVDNIHQAQVVTVDGLIYCNAAADSTEKLNTNHPLQLKTSGVCNPTYQRY